MKKKTKLLLASPVVLVVVYFFIWLGYQNLLFNKYSNKLDPYADLNNRYIGVREEFQIYLKRESFPFFGGNLAITYNSLDRYESLLIWPNLIKDYQYGLMLQNENGSVLHIYVDESLNQILTGNEMIDEENKVAMQSNQEAIQDIENVLQEFYNEVEID